MPERCKWPGALPIYVAYHDEEWGVPVRDDRELFEHLLLDGAQAGLSWLTILKKRENYRRAFDGFDPEKMARYGPKKIEALLQDSGIIRNRQKVQAFVTNARAFLDLRDELGSFGGFLWSFVGGETKQNAWTGQSQLPAETEESRAMSRALKERGFKFVGPTICYAFMQAAGLVNDHVVSCFRYAELGGRG
ncbi:MAG TPA: DNA-3-methyladenine glycosylase I [Longimicrobiales bacterium]|nr:DNA-3-methyladenine glycosylase I [Longimicrobiales bacterium]